VVLVVAFAVSFMSVAYAAIPDGSGVIHGCYQAATGSVAVIDSESGQTCPPGHTALNWNQTGPQGLTGPQGATGPAGVDGVSGYEVVSSPFEFLGGVGLRSSHRADCSAGKSALGGGYDASKAFGTEVDVVASRPVSTVGWWVEFYPTANHSLITVYVICASVGS
jgi:hypothetical protein